MKISRIKFLAGAALLAGFFTCMAESTAFGEDVKTEKSQALLEKVKQRELDRQISARQTEMDRLKEDLSKSKTEADGVQQTIDATTLLITESGQSLEQFLAEKRRLQHSLNVAAQNIEAERRKAEG